MKKVLIVGANSILSKALIDCWLGRAEITVVYNSYKGNYSVNYLSLSDLHLLNDVFDYVFLVSALITNDLRENENLFKVNVGLVERVVNKFLSAKLIYFSSVSIFDGLDNVTITSDTPPSPATNYGISKLWAEKLIENHKKFSIIRIGSMYGIGMKENTFLPAVLNKVIKTGVIELFGDGSRRQNYIHVRDVAQLASKAALENRNILILGINPEDYSNNEVAQVISSLIECKLLYKGVDTSRSVSYQENDSLWCDHDFITLKQGIKEIIEWKKKNQF